MLLSSDHCTGYATCTWNAQEQPEKNPDLPKSNRQIGTTDGISSVQRERE